MTINITAIHAFNDNYIWAITQENEPELTLVDPGQAEPCIDYIEANDLKLTNILITHHHGDHVGAVKALVAQYGNDINIYGPATENIPLCRYPLTEGDSVNIDKPQLSFQVLDVPGHTAGHIVYVNDDVLFCGDTLFSGGCGRLFEGTPAQMHHSLAKLKQLPPSTTVYCAHEYTLANLAFAQAVEPNNGELNEYVETAKQLRAQQIATIPTTMARELAINPFLRADQAEVQQSAQSYTGATLSNEVDVFAAVRRWKDEF